MTTTNCPPIQPTIKNPRVLWIDLFRVITILLSLAVHFGVWHKLMFYVGGGRICFFLFITALFLKKIDWESTKKRTLTIAVPYFVWCIILAYTFRILNQSPLPNWSSWDDVSYIFGLSLNFGGAWLWFLRVMIICILLNPILSRLNLVTLCAIVLLNLIGAVCTWFNPSVIDICSNYDACLLFWGFFTFVLGVICRKYIGISDFLELCSKYHLQLLAGLILLMIANHLIMFEVRSVYAISSYITSIFGTPIVCITLAHYLPKLTKKVNILAESMFFVFASQMFPLTATRWVYSSLIDSGMTNIAEVLLLMSPFIMLLVSAGIYFVLKRCKIFDGWLLIKHWVSNR